MRNVLFVTSSPRGLQSYSQRIARGIVDDLKIQDPSVHVVVRNLAKQPLPHASEDFAIGRNSPPDRRNEAAVRALALSDAIVDELAAADVIVIAAPMHNFGIPSALKAWIDHIVRPGHTFTYSDKARAGSSRARRSCSSWPVAASMPADPCSRSISRSLICARCSVSSA